MDDFVTEGEKLHNVARDDLLRDIEYSLRFRNGKPVNTAKDVAFALTAGMVLDHLELAGYIFKRKPPTPLETSRFRIPMKD